MIEFTDEDTDLLELFVEKLDEVRTETRSDDGYIVFCGRRYDPETKTNETICRSIKQSEFENVRASAAPNAPSISDYLRRLLWIREVKFKMPPQLDSGGMIYFVRDAFTLNNLKMSTEGEAEERHIDNETIEQWLYNLHVAGDIRPLEPTCRESGEASEDGLMYFLTPQGKSAAKKDFEKMGRDFSVYIESPLIAQKIDGVANPKPAPKLKSKSTKSGKKRNTPKKKEHEQKISNYITEFLTLCLQNEKVNKGELAKKCGLPPGAVSRKKSKYYHLIKAAEDRVKNPNFCQDPNAVTEFFFETKKKLGLD